MYNNGYMYLPHGDTFPTIPTTIPTVTLYSIPN